ncbi:PEP-CTERM sorting domain-containing protein [Aestuariispira ectoiniformans]|uniref:PEP-CTERM sorting domain-containing protein n=1 Tax=Aestuariispira ectoiniformans TaxID=2775080 RepID=UPI00223BAB30|nr:PEP-CTERM sorting domain-containing protein [Aestuariispira ectoiniformans]
MTMLKKHLSGIVAAAVVSFAALGSAQAAPVTYFGEDLNPAYGIPAGGNAQTAHDNFHSALTAGVQTENFEGFNDGDSSPLGLSFTGSGSTINGSLKGNGEIDGSGSGRFPTSGSKLWEASGSFSVEFDSPVAAFGFYGTDIGDFDGQITLALEDITGTITNLVINNTINGPNAALLFFGIIDVANPFVKVTFGNTSAGTDYFGFDDLTVGDVAQVKQVPAPSALGLLGLGLLGMGFAARRRRKA